MIHSAVPSTIRLNKLPLKTSSDLMQHSIHHPIYSGNHPSVSIIPCHHFPFILIMIESALFRLHWQLHRQRDCDRWKGIPSNFLPLLPNSNHLHLQDQLLIECCKWEKCSPIWPNDDLDSNSIHFRRTGQLQRVRSFSTQTTLSIPPSEDIDLIAILGMNYFKLILVFSYHLRKTKAPDWYEILICV